MTNPDEELRQLLEEMNQEANLPDFERRKRRMERVFDQNPALVAEALRKARNGEPLTEDEFILTHCGFLPEEWTPEMLAETQRRFEREQEESKEKVLDEWRALRRTNPQAGGEFVTRMLQEADQASS